MKRVNLILGVVLLSSVATAQTSEQKCCGAKCDTLLLGEERNGNEVTMRYLVRGGDCKSAEAKLMFPLDVSKIEATFGDNAPHIEALQELLDKSADTMFHVVSVVVTGYASPDGVVAKNKELAIDRAAALAAHIQKAWPNVAITQQSKAFRWSDVVDAVKASSISNQSEVVAVLTSNLSESEKEERLKHYPKAWSIMTHNLLPTMRKAEANIAYSIDAVFEVKKSLPTPAPKPTPAVAPAPSAQTAAPQPVAIVEEEETGIIIEVPQKEHKRRRR